MPDTSPTGTIAPDKLDEAARLQADREPLGGALLPTHLPFPRRSVLNAMVVVAVALTAALGVGFLIPSWQTRFMVTPSPELLNAFALSIGVLLLHKVESYISREYDECPVYLTLEQDAPLHSIGQNHFRLLIMPTMAGLMMVALAMRGPPWPMLMIGAWLSQGLHEVHHLGKTIATRKIYPGFWTAIAFVVTMSAVVAPRWFAEIGMEEGPWVYLAVQPVLVWMFAVIHQRWQRRYEAWLAGKRPI